MTVPKRLSDRHDVRHDPLRLERPVVRTESSKPGLHFVGYANTACFASVPISFLQVPGRENYLTPATQRRFANECRQLIAVLMNSLERRSHVTRVSLARVRILSLVCAAIDIGHWHFVY